MVPLVLVAVGGCQPADIDSVYGKRRGSPGGESVCGTAVLASLFEEAGHRVLTWRRLSPKLDDFNTIIWFPDSFALPTAEERTYLEDWLSLQPGRTLVYVGRDYDAASEYWDRVRPSAPPSQVAEVARRAAVARAIHDERRAVITDGDNCQWFSVRAHLPPLRPQTLDGPWSEGIDASQIGVRLDARFRPANDSADAKPADGGTSTLQEVEAAVANEPADAKPAEGPPSPFADSQVEPLLSAGPDPLVTKLSNTEWGDSKILIVTNGSFLLNLPLVNHQHRKIAGKLVAECGPPGRVAFLESGESGLTILDQEPGAEAPTGFEVFTVWPIGVILLHLTALGMLACIALFPVFGRPRELPPAQTADFGEHVTAVGELLEMTANREYALNRLKQYEETLGKRRE
jgi:hypothetical protein